ncbi:MAG: CopG family transcriptional regulator, partial [Edaphobacter sp.]
GGENCRDDDYYFDGLGHGSSGVLGVTASLSGKGGESARKMQLPIKNIVISLMYIEERFMRTLVDIPDEDLGRLNELSSARRVSRAELVRSAISLFLRTHGGDVADEAFGLWTDSKEDGLAYQKRMRSEW